ncbi:MAG: OmpH family outer membrane protein [Bacteroidia bacterium]|nr:OmpH family outer membrane protein [Bacteroidia bacterium]MDW8159416.1 OmpH family outer membrane protein [Bacteroidia bacterium]
MKKIIFFWLLLGLVYTLKAQRFGIIDTQFILEKMTEYQSIQKEVEQLSQQWQRELEEMYKKIEKKYSDYKAKEVLLSKEDIEKLQNEIMEDEAKAKEYQKKRFGYNGDIFKIREEKMRPVQEKLYKAVEEVSKEKNLNFMFDKAAGASIVFADPKFDYSSDVLKKLGIDPNAAPATEPGKPSR